MAALNGNEFEVIISGDDKPLQRSLKRTESSLRGVSNIIQGIGVGIGAGVFITAGAALSKFVGGSIDQFQEAERAVNSLRQSLEAIGREDLFEGLQTQVASLQNTFKYLDDDDITAAFQRLIQVGGLTRDEMNRLIPVIVDLNAKQRLAGNVNKTVAQSAEDIVKGLTGQGGELKKYGVEISTGATQSQKLSTILTELAPKVRGAGDAFGNSLEGKIAATTTRVEELQEALGSKLLPLKSAVISFALDAAKGFERLYEKLTGTYESAEKARKSLGLIEESKKKAQAFVSDDNTRSFLGLATEEEFNKYLNYYEGQIDKLTGILGKKQEANPDAEFPALTKNIANTRALVDALKEQRRVILDTTKIGTRTGKQTADDKKEVDALKLRIAALKELIAVGVDVSKNSLELKGLDIQLILRDAKANGFSQQDAEKLIFAKYPDFKGGLKLSQPLFITADFEFEGVKDAVESFDAAGDDLAEGVRRMYARMAAQAKQDGEAARKAVVEPLDNLKESIGSSVDGLAIGLSDALGDIFAGKNPIAAFLSAIATTLQELGKALLIFGGIKEAVVKALAAIDPSGTLAIAAGIAAIAAGSLIRAQLSKTQKLADGGVVLGPTRALIGEAGPEMVIPLNRANQFMNGGGNGGGTVVFEIEGRKLRGLLVRENESSARTGGRPR